MNFVDTYQELKVYKPPTARSRLRDLALSTIAGGFGLLHDQKELFRKPRIQFLYIHHVFRDEEKSLAVLLEYLSRDHHFISYSEAVNRILKSDIDKPYICISSDDGLKNNLAAASILNDFNAKACFFICPSIIDERDPEKAGEFARVRLHFPPVEFLTWKEVEFMQKQGHEIGAHTLSHINIAATPQAALEEEIAGCHAAIKAKCGSADHFAYPYGRFSDFTEYGRKLVFQSGFGSCASAQRGCHITDRNKNKSEEPENLLIRRDHIILSWPLQHILYFLASSSKKASEKNNHFPGL
ncbi:polysaccharide deacetylase family protein [Flavitalea flava]